MNLFNFNTYDLSGRLKKPNPKALLSGQSIPKYEIRNFQNHYRDFQNLPRENVSPPMSLDSSVENSIPRNEFQDVPMVPQPEFDGFRSVNEIPCTAANLLMMPEDKSIVIAAPTGSGKTVIFEMAVIHLLMKMERLKSYDNNFKVVYMAPIKALCSERLNDWSDKFSCLGLKCGEVTGDTEALDLVQLPFCNLLFTTPEKWDALTRKWRDNRELVQVVKLFLIDEVHLLSEEKRGPILEAVVSRMKTIQEILAFQKNAREDDGVRFVAVSATLPNIEDVACWLGDARHVSVSEEYRPVKLQKVVMGYPCPQNYSQFRFEITLSFKLRALLFKYAHGKPALIFCSTRKGVMQTAVTLCQQITFHFSSEQNELILKAASMVKENKLRDCLLVGVGFHHAGMDVEDRHVLEDIFRSGQLPVLVATSTLALGVNLPAHLVIVKSTQYYSGGMYIDYSDSQLLQMIGRAGRPQFDTEATAVIMTRDTKKERYERLVQGKDTIESNLHRHLIEHINSEVVLGTITETAVAMNWIRSTFLYVRALKNPQYYGIPAGMSEKGIENKLQEMCLRELNALANTKLVTLGLLDVHPTEIGKLMANYYMNYETMKIFSMVTGKETLPEILRLIADCYELSSFQLRTSDKKMLNTLNKAGLRYPFKGLIRTTTMKVSCLIQAAFGCHPVPDPSLYQEMLRILRIGERVTKCLTKCLQLQPNYQSLRSAIILSKCFHCKLWENSPYVSKQLERIGPVLSELLVAAGKTSFKEIALSNPRDLERILSRAPPMGNKLQEAASHVPQFDINVEVLKSTTAFQIKIHISIKNSQQIKHKNTTGLNHFVHLIAGTSENHLLLWKRFKDATLLDISSQSWTADVPEKCKEIFIDLVSESWVGLDVKENLKLEALGKNEDITNIGTGSHPLSDKKVNKNSINSKQLCKSVAEQFKHASRKMSHTMGDKKLRMSTPKVDYNINLEQFLYTPTKRKKLTLEKPKYSSKKFIYPPIEIEQDVNSSALHRKSIPGETKDILRANVEKSDIQYHNQKQSYEETSNLRIKFHDGFKNNEKLINETTNTTVEICDQFHPVSNNIQRCMNADFIFKSQKKIENIYEGSKNDKLQAAKGIGPKHFTNDNRTLLYEQESIQDTYEMLISGNNAFEREIDQNMKNSYIFKYDSLNCQNSDTVESNNSTRKHLVITKSEANALANDSHVNKFRQTVTTHPICTALNVLKSQITFDLGIENLLHDLFTPDVDELKRENTEKQNFISGHSQFGKPLNMRKQNCQTSNICTKPKRNVDRKEILNILNQYVSSSPKDRPIFENTNWQSSINYKKNTFLNLSQLEEEDQNNLMRIENILSRSKQYQNSEETTYSMVNIIPDNQIPNYLNSKGTLSRVKNFTISQEINETPQSEISTSQNNAWNILKCIPHKNQEVCMVNDRSLKENYTPLCNSQKTNNPDINSGSSFFFDFSSPKSSSDTDSESEPKSPHPLSSDNSLQDTNLDRIYLSTSSLDIDFEQLD